MSQSRNERPANPLAPGPQEPVMDELESWEDAAAQAGDAATMLIAGIARGCPARGLLGMTAEDVEREWPTVTDSSSGEEIVALLRSPAQALAIAESWGSPYPID